MSICHNFSNFTVQVTVKRFRISIIFNPLGIMQKQSKNISKELSFSQIKLYLNFLQKWEYFFNFDYFHVLPYFKQANNYACIIFNIMCVHSFPEQKKKLMIRTVFNLHFKSFLKKKTQ